MKTAASRWEIRFTTLWVSRSRKRRPCEWERASGSYTIAPLRTRFLTGDGTATFSYDDGGRLVSVTRAGVTTTYAVNALGQRVRKTRGGSSTYFVYDEAGHLIGEYDNSGALIQETVWLGDIPVATIRPGGASVDLFYVHADHLNTPRRISRPSDNVIVWRWDSDPFGTTVANEDPDGDSSQFAYGLRFPGQYFDAETGLHYNYFRDYDPAVGRYVQSDPIGLRGGLNTYAYVGNRPLSHVDPLGLQEVLPFPGLPGFPAVRTPAFTPGTRENNDLVDAGQRAWNDFSSWLSDFFNTDDAERAGEDAAGEMEGDGVCPPGDGGGSDKCKQVARKCNARCVDKWLMSGVTGVDSPAWIAVCTNKCAEKFGCGNYYRN